MCTQCLQEQQACEKEWVWIIKLFFPYVKKNRHASGNMKPAFRLVIWTFTMALVCIPSSAYPLIAFREGEEELQKDLSF